MDRLEQEIKKRLAQSGSMEGINSEGLWNAISEASHPAEAPSKKIRLGFIWLLLALGAVGSISTFIFLNEDSSSAYSPRKKHKAEHLRLVASNQSQQYIRKGFLQETNSSAAAVFTKSEEEAVAILISDKSANYASNEAEQKLRGTQSQTDLSGKSSNSISLVHQAASNRQEELKSLSEDKKNEQVSTEIGELIEANGANEELFDELIADARPMQWLCPLNASQLSISPIPSKSPMLIARELPAAKKPISWKIHGGVVLLQNHFKNGTPGFADSLNTNISAELGYSIGGLVRIKQGNNWTVSVGIEYMQWNDRFDKVLLSDTLVEVNQGEVLGQNTRTVKHFNTASIITLPVQLEIYKDIDRFRLGMNLGASYSLILGQNGRLLKDDFTVVNYSQSEKRYTNFLSARFAPSVGFKLNRKVMVGAFCNVGIQGHGTNSINQLKSISVAIMPSIGLTFNY
jgi:hypothetical protein